MFVILKPDRDRDVYVEWSTGADGPTFAGDRAATLAHLTRSADHLTVDGYRPVDRLNRADRNGTSVRGDDPESPPWGDWTQPGFICDQRWLPRERLADVADRLIAKADILDLTDEILDEEET